MTKLTSKQRNSMSKSEFGMPGERKYPMPDKSHAANAKARATQMVKKGKLGESQKMKIDAKANKILRKSKSVDKRLNSQMVKPRTAKMMMRKSGRGR